MLIGQLAKAAVELVARASSTAGVAESIMLELCVLTGILLKRKLSYVFYGQLANAADELAARASSNVIVAESTTIDLCIECCYCHYCHCLALG